MIPIRKTIHPETKTLDEKLAISEYVASDESVDQVLDAMRVNGFRFDRFSKNAPFVDNHNYKSIESVLGKVIDFKVENGKLVETVQWAVDVPENLLAKKGFAMTQAGYLKAVSIGFLPEKVVTVLSPDQYPAFWSGAQVLNGNVRGGRAVYESQVAQLGLSGSSRKPNTIYVQQQQIELSAVVLGCNANALAKSYKDGILTDSDLELFSQEQMKRDTAWQASESAAACQARQRTRAKFLEEFNAALKRC